MDKQEGLRLVRALKGAPLSVLIGVAYLNRAVSLIEIEVLCGYKLRQVERAFETLSALTLAEQDEQSGLWRLTRRGAEFRRTFRHGT